MNIRVISALAAGVLALSMLGGCKPTPAPVDNTTPTTTAPTTEAITTTTEPTTPPTTTAPAPDTAKFNRLTGKYDNEAGASSRPVAVMIGNNPKSRPQVGLANADLYVEAETEGGITRMMAVFSDSSRLPAQLCPIRSARSPFVLMAQSLDAFYVHAGGSVAGMQTLQNSGVTSINGLSNIGGAFWRDASLRSSRGLEYSLSTSADNITSYISSRGLRNTSDRTPFTYGETASGSDCTQLQVRFSGAQTDSFVYNADTGLYKKYVGTLGNASAHVTTAGESIDVTNIVVMYDTKFAENETTISFNLSSGNGILCSGGKVRDIRWSRTASGLSFTETNGNTATFLPGKTYICLVNKANQGNTVTK